MLERTPPLPSVTAAELEVTNAGKAGMRLRGLRGLQAAAADPLVGDTEDVHKRLATLVMVTALIIFGICFEHFFLGWMDEVGRGDMEPVVHALLSELTLMGGIGLVVRSARRRSHLAPANRRTKG